MEPPVERGDVVAGFDGSNQARRAVWWAAVEAARRGRALLVVQAQAMPVPTVGHGWGPVVAPGSGPVAASVWGPLALLGDDRVRRHTEEELAQLAEHCRASIPGLAVDTLVEDGRAAPVLAAAADRTDAPLLVVGSTGLAALPRMLIGSSAAELIQSTPRPVVVVRDNPPAVLTDTAPVVVGVDGTGASQRATGFAFDFAARHGCPLHAVHARSDWPLDLLTAAGLWNRDADRAPAHDEGADRSLDSWRERYSQVSVRVDVVDDRPAQALLDGSEGARLLVVGSRGRGAVRRTLLGSVSHAALYHASCPIAIVASDPDTAAESR